MIFAVSFAAEKTPDLFDSGNKAHDNSTKDRRNTGGHERHFIGMEFVVEQS